VCTDLFWTHTILVFFVLLVFFVGMGSTLLKRLRFAYNKERTSSFKA
jgi:hypothetical protein